MERLALTGNGKIDSARLLAIKADANDETATDTPLRGIARDVSEIWCEVLGVPRAAMTDNFFDLGGHSLKANQAVTRIRRRLGRPLDLRDFFSAPNLGALCALLESRGQERVGGIARERPLQRLAVRGHGIALHVRVLVRVPLRRRMRNPF